MSIHSTNSHFMEKSVLRSMVWKKKKTSPVMMDLPPGCLN